MSDQLIKPQKPQEKTKEDDPWVEFRGVYIRRSMLPKYEKAENLLLNKEYEKFEKFESKFPRLGGFYHPLSFLVSYLITQSLTNGKKGLARKLVNRFKYRGYSKEWLNYPEEEVFKKDYKDKSQSI